jgi:spermidine/putrescine-binding protein
MVALISLAFILISSSTYANGNLSILCWEGYADDSFVKPFEEQTGCKCKATYIGSNDEFVAKIMSGGAAYDVISPSNDTTMRLIDAGAVEAVDVSRVPEMKSFYNVFSSPNWLMKDGKIYGVPYGWGIQRIIVDGDEVPNPPNSLSILWDPKYRHKISIWDDVEAIYTAARYLGFKDSYNLTDDQLEEVKKSLIKMKPNIRKYWFTTGEMGTLMAAREIVAGNCWEETLVKLWKEGRNIIDLKPKEGRGGWSDSWMIVKGSGKNDCVYKWLNYNASGKGQALAHEVTGFGYSNKTLSNYLTGEAKERYHKLGMDNPDILSDVDWWQPVKRRAKYLEIWNQVKAAPVE